MKMQLFEIKDRFNITGRGIVYMINNPVFISFDNLDGVDVIGEVLEMHM